MAGRAHPHAPPRTETEKTLPIFCYLVGMRGTNTRRIKISSYTGRPAYNGILAPTKRRRKYKKRSKRKKGRETSLKFREVAAAAFHEAMAMAFVISNWRLTGTAWTPLLADAVVRIASINFNRWLLKSGLHVEERATKMEVETRVAIISDPLSISTRHCFCRDLLNPTAPPIVIERDVYFSAVLSWQTRNGEPMAGPHIAFMVLQGGKCYKVYLHPLWLQNGICGAARSKLERIALSELHRRGRVAFTPTTRGQIEYLQKHLGHRWHGSIAAVNWVVDYLIMPIPQCVWVSVTELFGVSRVSKYDNETDAVKIPRLNALTASCAALGIALDVRKNPTPAAVVAEINAKFP